MPQSTLLASILTTSLQLVTDIVLRQWLYRLGNNPKRSMRRFLSGLLLAAIAGGFIALGYYQRFWFQIIGLAVAIPAIILMVYGYLGILANRLAQVIKPKR